MKKLLCILLSVVMVLSSGFVMGASAADGYVVKNPVTDSFSTVEEFIAENGTKEFYGFTYDFLYNSTGFVDWNKLDIVYEQNGLEVRSTGNSIALARADMNLYLKRLFTNFFGGEKLYTEEYATKITNFVGKMINPAYVDKTITFGTNPNPNEEDFFELIADNSGLSDLIQVNWCNNPDIDFKSFLTTFGVRLNNLFTNDYADGHIVATELLRAAAEKIIMGGPLDYAFNLLWSYSKNYSADLYNSTMALFALKVNAGKLTPTGYVGYTTDELKSIEGLFEIMFGNITDYRFMPFPKTRVSITNESPEAQLFMMMYFAMNYMYKNNVAAVNELVVNFNNFFGNSGRYSKAGYNGNEISEVLSKINMMFDCIFKGDISNDAITMIHTLTEENLDATPDDLLTRLMNSIAKLFRKIADYFDYLFKVLTGEIEYGKPY